MKKTTILITALIMLFVSAPQAKATPMMYYTFEGPVTYYYDYTGVIPSQFGGSVPTTVTYTIAIDFDADATETYMDGDMSSDPGHTSTAGFYADAYSGDYLSEENGGKYNAGHNVAEYNVGVNSFWGTSSLVTLNSDDAKMSISSSPKFSDLIVGDAGISGENVARDGIINPFSIRSSLTLMSISATAPVPEPSILLLLGSGLLALGMFRRMRQEG